MSGIISGGSCRSASMMISDVLSAVIDSSADRGLMPEIAGEPQHADAIVPGGKFPQNIQSAVPAPVVDKKDLVLFIPVLQ